MTTEKQQLLFEEPIIETKNAFHFNGQCPEFKSSNIAIVTGGASGIGKATALLFAYNGAAVVLADINRAGLQVVIKEGIALGINSELFHSFKTDLRDADSRKRLVEFAAKRGNIRWLFNIAGIQHIDAIVDFPDDKWELMIELMLNAPRHLTKLVWPHMVAGGGGVIGNMGSVHSVVSTVNKAAYNTVKGGLLQFTNSTNAEGAEVNIRAINLEVGYVATKLALDQIPTTAKKLGITPQQVITEVMLQKSLVKRMMTPLEVAEMFLWNTSSRASFVRGRVVADAGFTSTYTTVPI